MSLAGFKKQFNKTTQFLSEKVAGSKGSELDQDILELSRKLDVVNQCVEETQARTKEYLQPNPSARTKLAVQASYQKARGQVKDVKYPQPEFSLGRVFSMGGGGINDMSPYGLSLVALGSAFDELSEVKDNLEFSVTSNFLNPLYEMQQKDLKEINHHRKKMESRRLDYDYKNSRKGSAEDITTAQEKFAESKELCYSSMLNFFEYNDDEHVRQLHAFAEAVRDYHKHCADIMGNVTNTLSEKLSEAASRPREERLSSSSFTSFDDISIQSGDIENANNDIPNSNTSSVSINASAPIMKPPRTPCCRAIYSFEAENEGELEFEEGDVIELKSRIDENWLDGTCNGKYGYFPENFVEIMVPL